MDEYPKVTLIETRYVEVEAKDFKSIVQSLTGKDSCVSWIGNSSYDQEYCRPPPQPQPQPQPQRQPYVANSRAGNGGSVGLGGNNVAVVDSSFGDMVINGHGDVLTAPDIVETLQDLLPMEELDLWSWNYYT